MRGEQHLLNLAVLALLALPALKSTIIDLLPRFYEATAGRITISAT